MYLQLMKMLTMQRFGIYENNIVRERGVWKISRMDLDYTWNANYSTGWARVTPPAAPYPELAVTAFHYKNPVSGRDPPELLPP